MCHFIVKCCHQFKLRHRCLVYSDSGTLCTSHLYPRSNTGRTQFRIQPVSKTWTAVSLSGLNTNIALNMASRAVFSSSPILPIVYSCRGRCTESLKRPTSDLLSPLCLLVPSSLNHSNRASHFGHHADGSLPSVSTFSLIIPASSWVDPPCNALKQACTAPYIDRKGRGV